jgi:eukaryotic-like serine/threonine-protein kinase
MTHQEEAYTTSTEVGHVEGHQALTAFGSLKAFPGIEESGEVFSSPTGYELLEVVGRGGMGIVFRARDLRLKRDVAIKLLRYRLTEPTSDSFRFLREEQITAHLQHPGIPPVHVIGTTEEGRPYLVMKLIQGRNLEQLLLAGEPLPKLAIFESICRTMAYAHAHRFIHRDLKPQNIMIGQFGEVLVMDWGVAKSLDDEVFATLPMPNLLTSDEVDGILSVSDATTQGSVVGTLAYLPPEQADGTMSQVGTWSDVFGLGGILLFLLTGRSTYVAKTASELRIKAQTADLSEAYAALDACTHDLELVNLCHRCLSANPQERPTSAQQVLDELCMLQTMRETRLRDAERGQVEAVIRESESVKRQRLLSLTGGTLIGVLLLGLIVSTVLAVRAGRAENQSLKDRDLARTAEAQAKTREQGELAARLRADEKEKAATKTKEFLIRILRQSTAEGQATKTRQANPNITLKEALDFAAGEIATAYPDAPEIEAELRSTIGTAYLQLKHLPEAELHVSRSLECREKALGQDHAATVESLGLMSAVYLSMGQYARAEAFAHRAWESNRRLLGHDHATTLQSRLRWAYTLSSQGKITEAGQEFAETLESLKRLLGSNHADTLNAKNYLALHDFQTKNFARAETLYAEVIAGREAIHGPQHPATLNALNNLAGLYQATNRPRLAEDLLRDVLARREAVHGADHPETLTSVNNLAGFAMSQKDWPTALALNERAYAGRRKALGMNHPDTLLSVNNLGGVAYEQKDYPTALRYFQEALTGRETLLGPEHPETLISLKNVANCQRALGAWGLAEQGFRRIVAVVERGQYRSANAAASVNNLAECLENRRHYLAAASVRTQWLQVLRTRLGTPPLIIVQELAKLGQLQNLSRHYPEGERSLREALDLSETVTGWNGASRQHAELLSHLGESLLGSGQLEAAQQLLQTSLEEWQSLKDSPTHSLRQTTECLIRCYQAQGYTGLVTELQAKLPRETAPIPRLRTASANP